MELKIINLVGGVMELADSIMDNAKHVTIHNEKITEIAEMIDESMEDSSPYFMGYPKWFEPKVRGKEEIDYMLLSYELMAGAVNYQYWYGNSEIRPNGSCATMMYEMLDESFELSGSMHIVSHRVVCEDASKWFIHKIAQYRLPNAEKRIGHVKQISDSMRNGPNAISYIVDSIHSDSMSLEDFIEKVVTTYPGYSGDQFLKRPFLLAMMLYRRVGWFKKDIGILPIPADYQIPKMLRWMGCIEYSSELSDIIENDILIPSGSIMEAEIRAASIVACRKLAEESGTNMCEVDNYLWLSRNSCKDKFHLTVTTDY